MAKRSELQAYPETNLTNQLLLHQQQLLQFLFFTNYDIIYQTFQLKHKSYGQKGGAMVTSFKSEQIAKYYQSMSERVHIRILRDDIQLDKQLSKLQVLWHNRNWPYFHRYYFLKFILSAYLKTIPPLLQLQDKLIRNQQHVYYPVFKSINARQACLRQIKKQLAELTPNDVYQYLHISKQRFFNEKRKAEREKYRTMGYKLKLTQETHQGKLSKTKFEHLGDSFNHLTKLTLYAIDLITKWREYIWSLTHDVRKQKERLQYYFYDDNYLLKVLSDLGFMKVSFLSQFYQFAPKNDPFLLECVLSFEKRAQKTVQHELLKQIFMPQKQLLPQIFSKLEMLSQQYRHNIRSRNVYDTNALKMPIIRSQQKHINNQQFRQNVSNVILQKIQSPPRPTKAKSIGNFRVRELSGSKKKILVEFQKKDSPLRRKMGTLPGSIQKTVVDSQKDHILKNSVILQKNQNFKPPGVDQQMLNSLKLQVIRRVKQDFQAAKTSSNKALQLFIDSKLSEALKGVFPFQPQKQLRQPLVFTPLSIPQKDLAQQLQEMFKCTMPEYAQMQMTLGELSQAIQQLPYVYFVIAKKGDQQVGRVLCGLDAQVKEFKTLKIIYLHFLDRGQIEALMIEFVKFLWKFQNSFEVHFRFLVPSSNEAIKMLVQNMQSTLQKQCIAARKDIYSTVAQLKFIFKRPSKNVNFIPNLHPLSLCLRMSLLYSEKKLMLQTKNDIKNLQFLCYDYMLMQAIRRFVSAQQIILLKQRVTWKDRLRMLMDMLKQQQQGDHMHAVMKQIQANNITQLNNYLTKNNKTTLQVSDLVKNNHLNMIYFELVLTPDFMARSFYNSNHQQYYRYTVNGSLSGIYDQQGTYFYFIPLKDQQNYELVLFSAKQYLADRKVNELNYLSMYLQQRLVLAGKDKKLQKVVQHLWVPMCRYPQKYKARQEMFQHTVRVGDLFPLKKEVLIGQHLEWFCSMQMENSIVYQQRENDLVFGNPLGLGVVMKESKTVIYARIFI